MDEQVTPVTDQNVRRKPQGFWQAPCGYWRLGTGKWWPTIPKTILDCLGVVGEWSA